MFFDALLILGMIIFSVSFFTRFADLIGRAVMAYLIISRFGSKTMPDKLTLEIAKSIREAGMYTGLNFMIFMAMCYLYTSR